MDIISLRMEGISAQLEFKHDINERSWPFVALSYQFCCLERINRNVCCTHVFRFHAYYRGHGMNLMAGIVNVNEIGRQNGEGGGGIPSSSPTRTKHFSP